MVRGFSWASRLLMLRWLWFLANFPPVNTLVAYGAAIGEENKLTYEFEEYARCT